MSPDASAALPLGVQLYSTRDDLGPHLGSTLRRIREIGYTHVEPYDIVSATDDLRRGLDETGLLAAATHAKITELDRRAVVRAAVRLGIHTVIVPWVEPERLATAAGVAAFAAEINGAARYGADHGIRVGYHNHDFEFSTRIDGAPAWEVLVEQFDESIILELDTYWASVGGADVFELLPRYADRIRYLHLKNEPPDEDDPPLQGVDITGRMDEVLALSKDFVELNVVEIVVGGDVFPSLARNHDYFTEAQARAAAEGGVQDRRPL